MNLQMATNTYPLPAKGEITGKFPRDTTVDNMARRLTFSTAIIPTVLLAVYLAQCAWFIQSQSFTFDEPINILSGLEQWRTGQFSGGLGMNDHPPLSRILCTLPAINSKFQVADKTVPNPESVVWKNSDFDSFGRIFPDPQSLAWHTRPVNMFLGTILGLLLWLAARSIYSTNAANFALALFALSPSLIAHFSLAATNDGIITLMLFATVFQLCRWRRNQSRPQTVLLGLVLGGLLISKASAIPFFVATIALMLVLKSGSVTFRPSEWNWRQATTAILISFFVVWGAYHFHVSKVTFAAPGVQMRIVIPNRPDPVIRQFPQTFHISFPVPAFEFIRGLGYQFVHNERGHSGFLLGHAYRGGSPLYFPVVVIFKWPIMVLVLLLSAIGLIFFGGAPRPRDFALWSIFPVTYILLAEFVNLNTGERYILPIYPFGLLLCGSLWQFTRGRRAIQILLFATLAVHIGDVTRYAPDYLSYFNPFVRSGSSYKLLSDSNVDWGEGLVALLHYQEAHPSVPIHLAYFGNVAPAVYGIRSIPLMPNERASGTVVVSANFLSGQTLPDPDSYHWLLKYPTKLILNHSLYVFEVPDQAIHQASAVFTPASLSDRPQ
jgi:hypothetical protein